VALAILAVGGWLGEHYATRWYWGASSTATLGEASRDLAARLDGAVTLTIALPRGHALRRYAQRLASAYRREHDAFRIDIIDPEAQSRRARELGLVRTGQTLIQYGDRAETVGAPTEGRISAALERLLRRDDRFVAFVTGNGARDLMSNTNYDLGNLGDALERKGYRLQPLDLGSTGSVPANASMVVLADPEESLGARQQAALRQYLRAGGALLWLADPGSPGAAPVLPAAIGETAVTDPASGERLSVDDGEFIVLDPPFEHPAAAKLDAPVVLKGAAMVNSGDHDGWQGRPLLPRPERIQGDTGALALGMTHRGWGARAIVAGDVDLFTNTYLGNGDNLRLGLQLVDWLADADSYIGTYVEPAPDQRLKLGGPRDMVLIGLLLAGIPILLIGIAGWQWRRLRRG
jgi:hypothetical protein